MKNTIIVTTDFSDSAKNVLNYACEFALSMNAKILLTHVYNIPAGFSFDGIGLGGVDESIIAEQGMLNDEYARVAQAFPGLEIEKAMQTGTLKAVLKQLNDELKPLLIIVGAIGGYSDFMLWKDEWLEALTEIVCPLLVVPVNLNFKPIRKIGLACDFKKDYSARQKDAILRLAENKNASLHIIHITKSVADIDEVKKKQVMLSLDKVNPECHIVQNQNTIEAVSSFVKENDIDLLIVVPRKHGVIYNLLNRSNTKQMARMEDIPVLAINEDY